MNYWDKSFSWKRNGGSLCTPFPPTCPLCPGGPRRGSGRVCKAFEPSDRLTSSEVAWHHGSVCVRDGREQDSPPNELLLLLWRARDTSQAECWISGCELEGNVASMAVHSAAWLSWQVRRKINQPGESRSADHYHSWSSVSFCTMGCLGSCTRVTMVTRLLSLHKVLRACMGWQTYGKASLFSLKGLWVSAGQVAESRPAFFFIETSHLWSWLCSMEKKKEVQYDEYSGRGDVL